MTWAEFLICLSFLEVFTIFPQNVSLANEVHKRKVENIWRKRKEIIETSLKEFFSHLTFPLSQSWAEDIRWKEQSLSLRDFHESTFKWIRVIVIHDGRLRAFTRRPWQLVLGGILNVEHEPKIFFVIAAIRQKCENNSVQYWSILL